MKSPLQLLPSPEHGGKRCYFSTHMLLTVQLVSWVPIRSHEDTVIVS